MDPSGESESRWMVGPSIVERPGESASVLVGRVEIMVVSNFI